MKEKVDNPDRYNSGYFKPKGKKEKRRIHKFFRKHKNLPMNKKGIMNRIGIHWEEWS